MIFGFGPLEDLLRDPSITEIMVNGPTQIYVEPSGKLELSDAKLHGPDRSAASSSASWPRSAAASTRAAAWSTPACRTARRVNAIIPPLALKRPVPHHPQVPQGACSVTERPDRSSAR